MLATWAWLAFACASGSVHAGNVPSSAISIRKELSVPEIQWPDIDSTEGAAADEVAKRSFDKFIDLVTMDPRIKDRDLQRYLKERDLVAALKIFFSDADSFHNLFYPREEQPAYAIESPNDEDVEDIPFASEDAKEFERSTEKLASDTKISTEEQEYGSGILMREDATDSLKSSAGPSYRCGAICVEVAKQLYAAIKLVIQTSSWDSFSKFVVEMKRSNSFVFSSRGIELAPDFSDCSILLKRLFGERSPHDNTFRSSVEHLFAAYWWEKVTSPTQEYNLEDFCRIEQYDMILERIMQSALESGHTPIGSRILTAKLSYATRIDNVAAAHRAITRFQEAFNLNFIFQMIVNQSKHRFKDLMFEMSNSWEEIKSISSQDVDEFQYAVGHLQGIWNSPERKIATLLSPLGFASDRPDVDLPHIKSALRKVQECEVGGDCDVTESLRLLRAVTDRPDLDLLQVKSVIGKIQSMELQGGLTDIATKKLVLLLRSDINRPDLHGLPPMFYAAKINACKVLALLLDCGADPNTYATPLSYYEDEKEPKVTALIYGITKGFGSSEKGIKILLSAGANPNLVDGDGRTALIHAARKGLVGDVQALLAHDADVNYQPKGGLTAIAEAAMRAHFDVVSELLSSMAENDKCVHCEIAFSARTALHLAAFKNRIEVAEYLIELNPEAVHHEDQNQYMPIHNAAAAGHADMVELLLGHRANVNAGGSGYGSALDRAIAFRHRNVAAILVKNGARLEYRRTTSFLMSYHYADFLLYHEVVDLMLQRQPNFINLKSSDGYTLVHVAAENGHVETLEILLKHGAKYDVKDSHGRTPHDVAKTDQVREMLKLERRKHIAWYKRILKRRAAAT